MPEVVFTTHLLRFLSDLPAHAEGETVRDAFESVFAANPQLRSYVVDEQGALREHISVFVDGDPIVDRRGLTDALTENSEVFVLQALSGG